MFCKTANYDPNLQSNANVRTVAINTFPDIGFFLYPLKTCESDRFSDVFRGYRKRDQWHEMS